jgi:CBS domain-containing protein
MSQTIRDIMTRTVETVSPETTIKDAATLMKGKDFGSLPVVEGKKVVGVLTDRDITVRVVAEGRDPASTRLGEVMSKDIVSIRDDSNLQEAERLMHDRQLRRLPVVDAKGELVGYLSLAKVARTESPESAGRVIKGVSEAAKPEPMTPQAEARKRHQKTG